jgi:hypothetical protein
MIIQSNGINNAYSTTDQISQPPVGKLPTPPTEQKDNQANGFIADRTDLSAKALALSRSVPAAGSTSESGETKASEKGETTEEPAAAPPPQAQNTPQSAASINIRV